MSPCNDTGPAFLLNEIGPFLHHLHITFLLVYSNITIYLKISQNSTSLEIIPCQTIPYAPKCVSGAGRTFFYLLSMSASSSLFFLFASASLEFMEK